MDLFQGRVVLLNPSGPGVSDEIANTLRRDDQLMDAKVSVLLDKVSHCHRTSKPNSTPRLISAPSGNRCYMSPRFVGGDRGDHVDYVGHPSPVTETAVPLRSCLRVETAFSMREFAHEIIYNVSNRNSLLNYFLLRFHDEFGRNVWLSPTYFFTPRHHC